MPDQQGDPVRVKAVMVDAATLSVIWMNESAADSAAPAMGMSGDVPAMPTLAQAVPMPDAGAFAERVREVASTGHPHHVRTELIAMNRGSMVLVTSVYRLPGDENLLILTEHTWHGTKRAQGEPGSQRPNRRRTGR